jgi:hypothetical protein
MLRQCYASLCGAMTHVAAGKGDAKFEVQTSLFKDALLHYCAQDADNLSLFESNIRHTILETPGRALQAEFKMQVTVSNQNCPAVKLNVCVKDFEPLWTVTGVCIPCAEVEISQA